jgi:hypothetical protein
VGKNQQWFFDQAPVVLQRLIVGYSEPLFTYGTKGGMNREVHYEPLQVATFQAGDHLALCQMVLSLSAFLS